MPRIFPDQNLATRRLLLRPFSVDDVDAIVSAAGDELIQRWLPLPRPYTRDDRGSCPLDTGRGRVPPGRAATGNAASRRVTEKAGFRAEGVARSAGYVHGGRVDLVIYSLVRSDLGLLA